MLAITRKYATYVSATPYHLGGVSFLKSASVPAIFHCLALIYFVLDIVMGTQLIYSTMCIFFLNLEKHDSYMIMQV